MLIKDGIKIDALFNTNIELLEYKPMQEMPNTINLPFLRQIIGLEGEKSKMKFTKANPYQDENINVTVRLIKENHKGILQLLFYFVGIDHFDGIEREQLEVTQKNS